MCSHILTRFTRVHTDIYIEGAQDVQLLASLPRLTELVMGGLEPDGWVHGAKWETLTMSQVDDHFSWSQFVFLALEHITRLQMPTEGDDMSPDGASVPATTQWSSRRLVSSSSPSVASWTDPGTTR